MTSELSSQDFVARSQACRYKTKLVSSSLNMWTIIRIFPAEAL